jgi:Ca2+-binding RTX toxin-like protein
VASSTPPKKPKKVNEVSGLGADADHWAATKGPDDIYGGDTDDHLYGGPGNDTFHGGGGDDFYYIYSDDCKDGTRDRIKDKIDGNMVIFDDMPLIGFIRKKDGSLDKFEYKYQPPVPKKGAPTPKPIKFIGAYSGNVMIPS